MADNLRSQGQYKEADSVFQAAASMLRMNPDPRAEIKCLEARAFYAVETGKEKQSAVDIRRALALMDSLGESGSAAYLELQSNLAAALDGLGRFREAVTVYDRVMSGFDSSGRGTLMARTILLHEKALTLVNVGGDG
jgi:tetratricopeptide (TPR) repeat protein